MNIQGSSISRSYDSTSKNNSRVNGTSTLSNKAKITNTESNSESTKTKSTTVSQSAFVAYSENIKKQSTGLRAAASNAKDGANLVKTADSALKEAESVLKRMKEITSQAKNDNLSDYDRSVLQKEMNNLSSQIDEISSTTSYNGVNLLEGDGTKITKPDLAEDITTTTETVIPAKFNSNGNVFYAKDSDEALADTKALEELSKGNSIYIDAGAAQTEYIPNDDAEISGERTYSFDLGTDKFQFSKIVTATDEDHNGSYNNSTITRQDLGLGNNEITVDTVANALNNYSAFSNNFIAKKESDTTISITAKNTANAYIKDFVYKEKGNSTATTLHGNEAINLYEKGSSTALDSNTANDKLAAGEKLYIDAYKSQTVAENKKDYAYTPKKTIVSEVTTPAKRDDDENTPVSYKTMHFNLNSEGSGKNQYSSVRLDRMDAAAIGVDNLDISSTASASKSEKKIDSAREQVGRQRDYLSQVGSRLAEASKINEKSSDTLDVAQKIINDNATTKTTIKQDPYAQLSQQIMENAATADEQTLQILGTTTKQNES